MTDLHSHPEHVLYFQSEGRNYRFKVTADSVFIERQASAGTHALTQAEYDLNAFPVMHDRVWISELLLRLIGWYEADMGNNDFEEPEIIEWDDEGRVVYRLTSERPVFTAADFPDDPAFNDPPCMPSPVMTSWQIEKTSIPLPGESGQTCNLCFKSIDKCECDEDITFDRIDRLINDQSGQDKQSR